MSATLLDGLTLEEQKQTLLKVSQFLLRKPSGAVRASIYSQLIEIGTYLLEREKKVELENILTVIENELFGIQLDEQMAKEFLDQLIEEKSIEYVNGKYVLEAERRSQIADYSTITLDLVYRTEEKLIDEISKKYDKVLEDVDEQIIIDSFYQFIILLVSKYVINTARYLVRGVLTRISPSTGIDIVRSSTQNISSQDLREIMEEILIEWMLSPDDAFVEYLYHMRQNFLCIEVLNLDPECRILGKEIFSKKRLFLDTNMLFHLVFPVHQAHTRTKKSIDNSLKLGCSLYVTNRTIEEYNYMLNLWIDEYETRRKSNDEKLIPRNILIKNYEFVKSKNDSTKWKEHIANFQNIEELGKKYNFNIYDKNHDDLKDLIGYDKTIRVVQQCFNLYRKRKKPEKVAEHDTFHLLLIKTIREDEINTFTGPDAWFYTSDLTLPCVDRFINRAFKFSDLTSASVSPSLWDEIISPLLVGVVEEKELVEVFKAFLISDFTPISEGVRPNVLLKLNIDWSEYDWLEFEEIGEILSQQFVLDYLERQEELTRISNHEALEQLRSEFNRSLTSMVGRISSRKIDQIKTELKETEERERILQTETTDLRGILHNYRGVLDQLKYLISALTWISSFQYFYRDFFLPTMEATSAATFSIIISTIIGYLIGFPGYKWLLEKLLSWKPTQKETND